LAASTRLGQPAFLTAMLGRNFPLQNVTRSAGFREHFSVRVQARHGFQYKGRDTFQLDFDGRNES
jgi:hypothetical protein